MHVEAEIMNWTSVCMAAACLLFFIAGVLTVKENWRTGVALVLLGFANALLLWEAS